MSEHGQQPVLELIKAALCDIGYDGGLLREGYWFADYLANDNQVEEIPIAAFTEDQPSYRHAAIGVAVDNGLKGAELIQRYKSLGAPQVFEVVGDRVVRWKVTGGDTPTPLQDISADEILQVFDANREEWGPERMREAKAGAASATQLDFFDRDFLPLLDHEIRTKLDALLQDAVHEALSANRTKPLGHSPALYRMIFRLLTAKVISDRRGTSAKDIPGAPQAMRLAEEFYVESDLRKRPLDDANAQKAAWDIIKSRIYFQNLSVDSLAYVYENTLVTPETRRLYGTHATPREVAEYIVNQLPFEDLEQDKRRVFEPFAGHSVFLVAAMQRLRDLLPQKMGSTAKHNYFRSMLCGMERDGFALEVAKLSLMLADYPNQDGWRLLEGDVFASPLFDEELERANVVLCNPPFEPLNQPDRGRYPDFNRYYQPAEFLERLLKRSPTLLGLVLPRSFLNGPTYRDLRVGLGRRYSSFDVVELPDRVFTHSDAETLLVMASGEPGTTAHLRSGRVEDRQDFLATRNVELSAAVEVTDREGWFAETIGIPRLHEVWEATSGLRRLKDLARVHRGVQQRERPGSSDVEQANLSIEAPAEDLLTTVIAQGVNEPFLMSDSASLRELEIRPVALPRDISWNQPKIAVNRFRKSRGAWVMSAAIDQQGMTLWQDMHAVWTPNSTPREFVAAVLNGPVANAFVAVREGKKDILIRTLKSVPIPDCDAAHQEEIASLVGRFVDTRKKWRHKAIEEATARERCRDLLLQIDAQVLLAYDLPVRVEHDLLDFFHGQARPGNLDFHEYIPISFRPHFPLHMHVSGQIDRASASKTLERIKPVPQSPLIDEALSFVD